MVMEQSSGAKQRLTNTLTISIQANGKTTKWTDLVNTIGQTEATMKGLGKMMNKMEMAFMCLRMERFLKDTGRMATAKHLRRKWGFDVSAFYDKTKSVQSEEPVAPDGARM